MFVYYGKCGVEKVVYVFSFRPSTGKLFFYSVYNNVCKAEHKSLWKMRRHAFEHLLQNDRSPKLIEFFWKLNFVKNHLSIIGLMAKRYFHSIH